MILWLACTTANFPSESEAPFSEPGGHTFPGATPELPHPPIITPPTRVTGVEIEGDKPTNLLVITLDTTRIDQLGYFTGMDTTVAFDRALHEAVVLTNHHSCSAWTAPSMYCALLGYSPYEEGWWPTAVYQRFGPDPRIPSPPERLPTLPVLLQQAGYWTGLVTTNGVFSPASGAIGKGFDEVWEPLWRPASSVRVHAEYAFDAANQSGKPWYIHLHFADPHTPYDAGSLYVTEDISGLPWNIDDPNEVDRVVADWPSFSPEQQEQARAFLIAAYRAQLRLWDDNWAALWYDLESAGYLDNTLVVFWTDHGEQHAEHGEFFHGVSLHQEENRSVAAFWAPGLVPGEFEGLTTHADLAPTILSLLELEVPAQMTGQVVGTALEDRTIFAYNYLFGWDAPMLSVQNSQYRMIFSWWGERQAYDVANDPLEVQDLYSPEDPAIAPLGAILDAEVQKLVSQWPEPVPVY